MNPTERWHPIAPAPAESLQQRSVPDAKKKRQAIAVACLQCRTGKVKVGLDVIGHGIDLISR